MKIIIWGMGLNEKALAAMDKTEKHRAMDRSAVPGHPEIFEGFAKSPDMVVTQVVVFGQDDLDAIAADFQFIAQSEHHVRKPANLRHGREFRGNLHDV
jgi:hypothetical protein